MLIFLNILTYGVTKINIIFNKVSGKLKIIPSPKPYIRCLIYPTNPANSFVFRTATTGNNLQIKLFSLSLKLNPSTSFCTNSPQNVPIRILYTFCFGTMGQFSGKPSNFALKTVIKRFLNARHRLDQKSRIFLIRLFY